MKYINFILFLSIFIFSLPIKAQTTDLTTKNNVKISKTPNQKNHKIKQQQTNNLQLSEKTKLKKIPTQKNKIQIVKNQKNTKTKNVAVILKSENKQTKKLKSSEVQKPTPFKKRFAMISEMPTTLGVKSFGIGTGLSIPWYMFFNPLQWSDISPDTLSINVGLLGIRLGTYGTLFLLQSGYFIIYYPFFTSAYISASTKIYESKNLKITTGVYIDYSVINYLPYKNYKKYIPFVVFNSKMEFKLFNKPFILYLWAGSDTVELPLAETYEEWKQRYEQALEDGGEEALYPIEVNLGYIFQSTLVCFLTDNFFLRFGFRSSAIFKSTESTSTYTSDYKRFFNTSFRAGLGFFHNRWHFEVGNSISNHTFIKYKDGRKVNNKNGFPYLKLQFLLGYDF